MVDDDGQASATDCNALDTASTTIQGAVNAANPGDIVKVCPGTYPELVTVNKSLTINGARSGVNAADVSRTGLPDTESVVTGNAGSTSFYITASDVTVDGFTVQDATNGNQFGARIVIAPSTSGTNLLNNIIQNNIAGIFVANNDAGNQTMITGNLIRNNNQPGPVSGHGIYTDQFISGGNLTGVMIENNTFTGNAGPAINLAATTTGAQTLITISANNFNGNGNGVIFNIKTDSTITANTFSNSAGSQIFIGGSGITLICNTIATGSSRGVRIGDTGNSNITLTSYNIVGNASRS